MATVRIQNLRLRTIIGANDWEREEKQDVVINVTFEYDTSKAITSDQLKDTVDYRSLTKKIIKKVEASDFFLLEKLANMILDTVMANHLIEKATVRVDKPFALRFADSVSVELQADRKNE